MRLLLAARFSQDQAGQTGLDTQDQDARAWAERNGHEVIATAADNISGRTSPCDRPNLGPWLTEPHLIARYDGIIVSKLDRLSRGRDWGIRSWAESTGKKLIVVSPELSWPPEKATPPPRSFGTTWLTSRRPSGRTRASGTSACRRIFGAGVVRRPTPVRLPDRG